MARRLFVLPSQVAAPSETLRITGQAHRHLVKVLRMCTGDQVTLFNGEGEEIEATLVRVHSDSADLVLGVRRKCPVAPVHISLFQAIAKGDRMDWILQKTTELGVARICPIITSRVVVRLDSAAVHAKQGRWQKVVQEAARQCGRADVPEVTVPEHLDTVLAGLPPSSRFVLWEEEHAQPLVHNLSSCAPNVALLVGPEGGLSEQEVSKARETDFLPVTLGPRILRTETAAIVAVALVQAATGGLA